MVFASCNKTDADDFLGLKIFADTASASKPETRITAIPPIPGAVDIAAMVELPPTPPDKRIGINCGELKLVSSILFLIINQLILK
jgi:hypothetical protein